MTCSYVIVPSAEITQEMVDSAIQTSFETIRKSIDGTLSVLKYGGDHPACFNGCSTYSHEGAYELMKTQEWRED